MENNNNSNEEWEKMKKEINVLMKEGRDYAHQLNSQVGSTSYDQESREHLAKKILESYHKSLTIMNYSGRSGELDQGSPPYSHVDEVSPKSDDSDQETHIVKSLKKSMPRWTQKVKITPGDNIDRSLEDGFSWRKYGQKDILGAKFPRGYYRCTYRKSQGCEATKQVQRCDQDDEMFFDIIYRGIHSCSQVTKPCLTIPLQNLEPNQYTQETQNLEIEQESLELISHQNYNHKTHLHQNIQYPFSSTTNLESQNLYMIQLIDHNVDLFGSNSFSSDVGTNMNYDFLSSNDVGSASHSTSNSPNFRVESPFGPNHPFGGFGGFNT